MGIESNSPKIALLRQKVENTFGKIPRVHNDFVVLGNTIKATIKKHISETTLERVWNYSNRGYDTVSLYTLDLLSEYAGYLNWGNFCEAIKTDALKDSDLFNCSSIRSIDLKPGDRIKLGWLPDRVCLIEYTGNNRFIAIECQNSTMKTGDTFSCLEFILYQPAYMFDYTVAKRPPEQKNCYVAGSKHGITSLKIMD